MLYLSPISVRRASTAARRFLRAPKVICAEIGSLALLCALGAALPQRTTATTAELNAFYAPDSPWTALVRSAGLDNVFGSPVFLLIIVLLSSSLLMIVLEQWRWVGLQLRRRLTSSDFNAAPLRAQFERAPAATGPTEAGAQSEIWSDRRLGVAGSAIFHSGLLLIIIAAIVRGLFGAEAVVDLMEGEELSAAASAWSGQFPSVAGRPVRFEEPVKLLSVQALRHESGDLEDLKIRLQFPETGKEEVIAVNRQLRVPGGRLFLANQFGPAAMIEWCKEGRFTNRQASLLTDCGVGNFEGSLTVPSGERVYLRAHVDRKGNHPSRMEIRVMNGAALLLAADAVAGSKLTLPSGETIALCGTPFWARIRGSRDSALWLAYTGIAVVMAGVVLMFGVIRLDTCIGVTPAGERQIVFVAMRPQRFAPLFQERFQKLVLALGGPATTLNTAPELGRASGPKCKAAHLQDGSLDAAASGRLLPSVCVALLFAIAGAIALTGCGPSHREARQLVERYNRRVTEAYRRADAKIADPVVTPNESRKIAGLIGVRQDLGLTLDSEILSLELISVQQKANELRVRTREQWCYNDRRIGSGAQASEPSTDRYDMLYVFTKTEKEWLVDQIQFTTPPQVNRRQMSWPSGEVPARLLNAAKEQTQ